MHSLKLLLEQVLDLRLDDVTSAREAGEDSEGVEDVCVLLVRQLASAVRLRREEASHQVLGDVTQEWCDLRQTEDRHDMNYRKHTETTMTGILSTRDSYSEFSVNVCLLLEGGRTPITSEEREVSRHRLQTIKYQIG